MRLTTKTSEADPDHLSDPDPFETVSFHGSGPIKKTAKIRYNIILQNIIKMKRILHTDED